MQELSGQGNAEIEQFCAIAGLVTDILFEYDFAKDRMMHRVCRDGIFGEPYYIEHPRIRLREYVHQEDRKRFDNFMQDIEDGKKYVCVSLRMRYSSDDFRRTVIEGAAFYTEEGRPVRVVGRVKEQDSDGLREEPFGYILVEQALLYLEQHANPDDAINMLIKMVAEHYDLSAVCIREKMKQPYSTRNTYEYLRKDYTQNTLGKQHVDSEQDWNAMQNAYHDGYLCYSREKGSSADEFYQKSGPLQTMLEIPMYRGEELVGLIDFCDAYLDREWSAKQIRTMKLFGRLIYNFIFRIRDYTGATRQIEHMKERDTLTGLYRYEVFVQKFRQLLAEPRDSMICVIYSDIRHFKYINEHYGLSTGDELLKMFAKELTENTSNLFSCRAFSDNVIAVVGFPKDMPERIIADIINSFNESFSEKVRKRFYNGKLNVNTGFYVVRDGDDVERAISNANMARKKAKEPGNTEATVMFTEDMLDDVRRQIQLTNDLPNAISNHELCVYYQPKVECRTGRVMGAEALIRWKKPDGTFLYPDTFIPVFERNGSIVELDYFVYREVFAWMRKRMDAGERVVPVSVNVSRFHLRSNHLLDYVDKLCEEYRVPAHLIEFELTENLYIENAGDVLPLVQGLRERGAKVAMDDFGSGFSSLNVLSELPIDVLKLDKVFMKKESLDEGSKAILTCVVEMAKKLHITVLCEGVENAEQDLFLCRIGCDMIQGYYYGKPMPVEEFEKMLASEPVQKHDYVCFPFQKDFKDLSGKYEAIRFGNGIRLVQGPCEGMGAVEFPESDEPTYAVLEIPAQLMETEDYTVTFWAKEETKRMWSSIFYTSYDDGFCNVMLHGWETKALFRIMQHKSVDLWCDAGRQKEPKNGWNFIAFSYKAESGVMQLYINGQQEGFYNPAPVLHGADKVLIGGDVYQPGFHGQLSELRIYSSVLTRLEIGELYREHSVEIEKNER